MSKESSTDVPATIESELHFGSFRLEAARQLWRSNQPVDIRPRSLAMLRYLAERPHQLVTKEELLKQLWPGIYVSSTVVKVCVREIRHALGDEAAKPQFIETVGAQGYQFIAPLTFPSPVSGSRFQLPSLPIEEDRRLGTWNSKLETPFVGREYELAQLQAWYERVQQGERYIVFVSGEAGIGKTTLVERFLALAQGRGTVRIGRGHCIEQHEHGEAYLPMLQALQQLCHAPDGDQVVAVLRRYAPLCLVQLSGVIETDELENLRHQVQGSSPQRMLREFAEAIEMLATETPVILFLEDLQWSDGATLELVEYLAQRREGAQLLVIGSYRPAEAVLETHALRRVTQNLIGRGQCQELALELFTQAEVEAYLAQRLAGSSAVESLGPVIHRLTEGNALFVMHFVDYLLQQDLLAEVDGRWELRVKPVTLEEIIPDHVQSLITKQIEGLIREAQQLLEIASVVGINFTASEVAAVINQPLAATEAVYDELANQERFLAVQGLAEWPDGSITVRYQFRHALCRHTLYHRIGLAQRVRWHRQLGEHFARLHGEHTQEVAGELAFHFECGREYRRAILFRQQAGEQALQQNAYQKALGHGQVGLALLTQLPATAERGRLELRLRQLVSIALATSRGFTDEELEENLQRAQQLCREFADDAELVPVLIGLTRLYVWRANRPAAEELARQEESLTERFTDSQLRLQLHTQLTSIETVRGRHARAADHYHHVRTLYDPHDHQPSLYSFTGDPLIVALGMSGMSLSLAGWLEQGWSRAAQGLARTEEWHQPAVLAFMLLHAGIVTHLRGEYDETWRLAQKMIALGREYELPLVVTLGGLLQSGMAVQRGSLEEGSTAISGGLLQYRAIGAQLFIPYFLSFLAEGYRRQEKAKEALEVVDEALSLTTTNLDVFWEAELYRIKGELVLQSGVEKRKPKVKSQKSKMTAPRPLTPDPQGEAEAYFHQAIEVACQQEARLLELRAVMSLARLWYQQGKKKAARQRLAEIYNWFTEGLDTKDLQAAKALLAELA